MGFVGALPWPTKKALVALSEAVDAQQQELEQGRAAGFEPEQAAVTPG